MLVRALERVHKLEKLIARQLLQCGIRFPEVIIRGVGRTIHRGRQQALSEALAVVEQKCLPLLDRERTNRPDECGVVRVFRVRADDQWVGGDVRRMFCRATNRQNRVMIEPPLGIGGVTPVLNLWNRLFHHILHDTFGDIRTARD